MKKLLCDFTHFHLKIYGSFCIKIVSRDLFLLVNGGTPSNIIDMKDIFIIFN